MAGIGQRDAHWAVPGFAEERQLGVGASGRVVAAVHQASGTRVAIKYLSPGMFQDHGFLTGFRDEAQLMRSLSTPHVVRLFDYVEEAGKGAAIVMELVNGVSLHEMITRQGPTGPESALLVLKGSLFGLAAAHSVGIVHRDYKPQNVLVDAQGQSKLTDFGIATRFGSTAAVAGTPRYMAPEQWYGAPATPSTDIYAATVVFFECLTGKTPFSGGLQQLAAQHVTAAVPVELVDESLRALIARGMAKDPAARPANATAFIAELEATAVTAYGQDWESRGRAKFAARAAALLLLLLDGLLPESISPGSAGGGTSASTAATSLGTPPGAPPATPAAASPPHANAVAAAGNAAPGTPSGGEFQPAGPASSGPGTSPAAAPPAPRTPPAPHVYTVPPANAGAPAPGYAAPAAPGSGYSPLGAGRRAVTRQAFRLSRGQWVATVVVAGAVAASAAAGALLGARHSSPESGSAASGSTAASVTAAPAAASATAACGSSGMPPLAYATSGSSSASAASVQVRCGTGTPRTVATVPAGAFDFAWSADGTQLAWLDSGSAYPGLAVTAYVAQVNAGTWAVRHWACQCTGMTFLGKQAVTVNDQTAGGPQQDVTAQPQLIVLPATGTGQPTTLPLTGVARIRPGTEFRLLGNVSPAQVVVNYGDAGGSDLGGAQTLYHVNAAGQATPYGHVATGGNGPNAIFGAVGDFAANRAGTEIAFSVFSRGGGCGGGFDADVINTATGAVTTPKTPAGGGPEGWWVEGMWFDSTGTAYVSLAPNLSTCTTGGAPPATYQPVGYLPIVCKLVNGTWVKTGSSGVFQASYGPGSWVAELTGPTTQDGTAPTTVTVTVGTSPFTISGVTALAGWAPPLP